MTGTLAPAGPAASAPGHAQPPGPGMAEAWRRWRGPAALVIIILLGGLVVALLQLQPPVTGALDPNDPGPAGARALVALLAARGQTVLRAGSVAAATQAAIPGTTLVVTGSGRLDHAELAELARVRASLLLPAPSRAALAALAPGVTLAGTVPVRSLSPSCGLPAARLAGTVDLGGELLRSAAPGAFGCYPASGGQANGPAPARFSSLVQNGSAGRVITVLGSGAPLSNSDLGSDGNAALALNLLRANSRVVWLVPGPPAVGGPGAGTRPLTSLIPAPVYAVAAQLAVAVLLTALWRMRRLGPLVPEPLPVVVRACETVQGHGRLYRSRRARDRASAALRGAALGRISARLGLPRDASPDVACQELASRTGRPAGEIEAILFGPVPGDDSALVRLATDLDALEGQVLTP